MSSSQPDLFAEPRSAGGEYASVSFEDAPPDFIARIRSELEATLIKVQQASLLPWPDLTQATLAELRFNSVAGWLPEAEALSLRARFETEIARLYQLEDERSAAD